MRHLDEGTIHAWLDGALSADEATRAEAHVASCTVCAEAVAEARGLIAASTRILTALDDVPGGVMPGTRRETRPRLFVSWLVRERIAAVVAVIVAGGALAVVLSRDTTRSASIQTASEPVQTLELTAADSPAPAPVPAVQSAKIGESVGAVRGRAGGVLRERDLAMTRQADTAPAAVSEAVTQTVTAEVAAAPPLRTDDTARAVDVAQVRREEAQELSAEGKSSLNEKLAGVLPGRRAAPEASARFAEPRAAAPSLANVVVTGVAGDARLLHEERMTEDGREVRRRIYRVDGILVTLDERLPDVVDEAMRARPQSAAPAAAPAQGAPAPQDSAHASTNTIRWTDARGAELTLTGPASEERLERIRKLLGY
jgi:hypothetical protein